jgi:hypothetical protein
LAQACIISSAFSFEFIKYLKTESDYLPYNSALNSLSFFTKILDSTPLFENYQKFFIDLIVPLYNSLGWEERDTDELHDKYEFKKYQYWLIYLSLNPRRLRTIIISAACEANLYDCVNKSKQAYAQWMVNESNNT